LSILLHKRVADKTEPGKGNEKRWKPDCLLGFGELFLAALFKSKMRVVARPTLKAGHAPC